MPAGREMDKLVATEIMAAFAGGFPAGQQTTFFPPYSTNDRVAAELLARTTTGRAWGADFGVNFNGECEATIGEAKATAPTLALAICRAALLARMQR